MAFSNACKQQRVINDGDRGTQREQGWYLCCSSLIGRIELLLLLQSRLQFRLGWYEDTYNEATPTKYYSYGTLASRSSMFMDCTSTILSSTSSLLCVNTNIFSTAWRDGNPRELGLFKQLIHLALGWLGMTLLSSLILIAVWTSLFADFHICVSSCFDVFHRGY